MLAGGLAVAFLMAWLAPGIVPLLPAGLVAAGVVWWLFWHPRANLIAVLVGFVVVLKHSEGLEPTEVAYGLYYYLFLLHWYGGALLRGDRFVRTAVDRAVLLLLVAGTIGGVILGVIFGAEFGALRGEAMAWLMLGLYFPVKEFCRTEERGAEVILSVFVIVGAFVAVQHFINFRTIILAATAEWQVADARPGFHEMQLLIPALVTLVGLVTARKYRHRAGLLVLFLLISGALILTKSRGYWIDFALGVAVLVLLLRGRQRRRLLLWLVMGSATAIGVVLVFFGPLADLVFSGTLNRFGTLGSAFSADPSLVNRFIESRTLLERIIRNPVLGYGFGTTFSFYDIVNFGTKTTSFIHNGYIALWYKLGILGLVLMLFCWGVTTWRGLQVYWGQRAPEQHRLAALIGSLTLIAIIPSAGTSNPFILMDQVYTFTLQLALAGGLYQRYAPREEDREAGVAWTSPPAL